MSEHMFQITSAPNGNNFIQSMTQSCSSKIKVSKSFFLKVLEGGLYRCEDNIKMDPKEADCDSVNWIHLAQGKG
jgi:hypothetical protein